MRTTLRHLALALACAQRDKCCGGWASREGGASQVNGIAEQRTAQAVSSSCV